MHRAISLICDKLHMVLLGEYGLTQSPLTHTAWFTADTRLSLEQGLFKGDTCGSKNVPFFKICEYLAPYLQNLAASSVERAKPKFAFSLPFPLIYILMFLSHSNVCLRLKLCSLSSDSITIVLYELQSTYTHYKFYSLWFQHLNKWEKWLWIPYYIFYIFLYSLYFLSETLSYFYCLKKKCHVCHYYKNWCLDKNS